MIAFDTLMAAYQAEVAARAERAVCAATGELWQGLIVVADDLFDDAPCVETTTINVSGTHAKRFVKYVGPSCVVLTPSFHAYPAGFGPSGPYPTRRGQILERREIYESDRSSKAEQERERIARIWSNLPRINIDNPN